MKRTVLALAMVALVVAACQKKAEEAPAAEGAVADASSAGEAAASAVSGQPRPAISLPQLAYVYDFDLKAPARDIPELLRKHEQACIDAGPATCQVIGVNLDSQGRDRTRGRLEVRATQAWIRLVRPSLEADAANAGGGLTGAGVTTDDLSADIVDTEAAIRSKEAMRARLEGMLRSRPGKLEEALEVERELARVQQEIDAARSGLAAMRTRVATSTMIVDYVSTGVLAPDSACAPVKSAANSFLGNVMGVLGGLIWVFSFLLPIALMIGPIAWVIARRNHKGRPRTVQDA